MDERAQTDAPGLVPPVLICTRRGCDVLALLLMLVFAIGAVTLSLLPVVTNELRTSLGLSDAQIGLLTSIFLGFYALAGITSGLGAARWGGWLLAVSCGCFVAGSLVFGLSSSFGGFLIGRAIQGVGGGMVIAVCNPVLARAVPPEHLGRAWGILGSGWGLGSMAGLLIMPSIQNAGGYRAVFLTTAALAFVVGVAAFTQRAVRSRPRYLDVSMTAGVLGRSFIAVLKNRQVLILGIANMASLAVGIGVLAWTPSFLQDVHGASEALSVYLVAGLGAAQLVATLLGAMWAARVGKFWVITGSLGLIMIITAVVGIVPGVLLTFVMVLLAGLFSMTLFPPMMAYMPEVVSRPEQVGPATGINTLMGFAGSQLAPWIFGLLLDSGGRSPASYLYGYLVLTCFSLVALVTMAFFGVSRRRAA